MARNKRSRGLTANQAKSLRKELGLSQKELGALLGRNASNISRFERGITKSVELENAYRRLDRQYAAKREAMAWLKEYEGEVRERLQELQEYKKKHGEQYLSPAGEYFVNKIGLDVFDFDLDSKDWMKQDLQTLRHNLTEVEKFLNANTSDVEGYKDYKKRLLQNAQSVSGLKGKQRNEVYWGVYNKLKNDYKAEMLERLGLSGGDHFSEQLEIEISVVIDEMGTDHSVDEVVRNFLDKSRTVDDTKRSEITSSFARRKKFRNARKH